MPTETDDRIAFHRFLDTLRQDIFGMYENLREVKKASDDEMEARMATLDLVAEGAFQVCESIAALNAAVCFGGMIERDARPGDDIEAPVPVRRRELVGVR